MERQKSNQSVDCCNHINNSERRWPSGKRTFFIFTFFFLGAGGWEST